MSVHFLKLGRPEVFATSQLGGSDAQGVLGKNLLSQNFISITTPNRTLENLVIAANRGGPIRSAFLPLLATGAGTLLFPGLSPIALALGGIVLEKALTAYQNYETVSHETGDKSQEFKTAFTDLALETSVGLLGMGASRVLGKVGTKLGGKFWGFLGQSQGFHLVQTFQQAYFGTHQPSSSKGSRWLENLLDPDQILKNLAFSAVSHGISKHLRLPAHFPSLSKNQNKVLSWGASRMVSSVGDYGVEWGLYGLGFSNRRLDQLKPKGFGFDILASDFLEQAALNLRSSALLDGANRGYRAVNRAFRPALKPAAPKKIRKPSAPQELRFPSYEALVEHLQKIREPHKLQNNLFLGEESLSFFQGHPTQIAQAGKAVWITPNAYQLGIHPDYKKLWASAKNIYIAAAKPQQLQDFIDHACAHLKPGAQIHIGVPQSTWTPDPFRTEATGSMEIMSVVSHPSSVVISGIKRAPSQLAKQHFLWELGAEGTWTPRGVEGTLDLHNQLFKPPFADADKKLWTERADRYLQENLPKKDDGKLTGVPGNVWDRGLMLYEGGYLGHFNFHFPFIGINHFKFGERWGIHVSPGFAESHNGVDVHLVDMSTKKVLYRTALVYHPELKTLAITEMHPEGNRAELYADFQNQTGLHPGNFALAAVIETARKRDYAQVAALRFVPEFRYNILGEYEKRFRQAGLQFQGKGVYARPLTAEWDPTKGMKQTPASLSGKSTVDQVSAQLAAFFKDMGW